MEHLVPPVLPIFLLVICVVGLALGLLIVSRIVRPGRPGRVTRMPYESGMDPIHDTRRRFDVRFHLLAIAFIVFDVELLFLYPWAVAFGGMNAAAAVGVSSLQLVATTSTAGQGENRRPGDKEMVGRSLSQRLPPSHSPSLLDPSSKNADIQATTHKRHLIFAGAMTFVALLTLGFVYDWRKGVFQWR
jgi:NADH-quinone oxidoreductase subunit A